MIRFLLLSSPFLPLTTIFPLHSYSSSLHSRLPNTSHSSHSPPPSIRLSFICIACQKQPNLYKMLRQSFAKNEYTENHEQSIFRMTEMRLTGLATFEFSLLLTFFCCCCRYVHIIIAIAFAMAHTKSFDRGEDLPTKIITKCITTTTNNVRHVCCAACTLHI